MGLLSQAQEWNLLFHLLGPDPILSSSKEVGPFGLESQPLFGKSGPNVRGLLQSSHEARAQVDGLPSSVLSGPSSLGCPVSEPFKFWVKDGLRKQFEAEF